MRYKLSANLGFLWKRLPLAERIRRAAEAGFDAVEFHDDWQDADIASLEGALAETGLKLVCLNTAMGQSFGLTAMDAAGGCAALDAAFDAARQLGGRFVHAVAGKTGLHSMPTYLANLRHACTLAQETGIGVLIEPIAPSAVAGYFLGSFDLADRVLAEIDDPSLKIMFDCFHAAEMGHALAASFKREARNIGHVQFAGWPGRAEPDNGVIDYPALFLHMAEHGYRGPYGAEYRPATDEETGLGWMAAYR